MFHFIEARMGNKTSRVFANAKRGKCSNGAGNIESNSSRSGTKRAAEEMSSSSQRDEDTEVEQCQERYYLLCVYPKWNFKCLK